MVEVPPTAHLYCSANYCRAKLEVSYNIRVSSD